MLIKEIFQLKSFGGVCVGVVLWVEARRPGLRGRLFGEREQGEGRGQTSRTPGPAHPGKEQGARGQKEGLGG